jgi:hypothetical protein
MTAVLTRAVAEVRFRGQLPSELCPELHKELLRLQACSAGYRTFVVKAGECSKSDLHGLVNRLD